MIMSWELWLFVPHIITIKHRLSPQRKLMDVPYKINKNTQSWIMSNRKGASMHLPLDVYMSVNDSTVYTARPCTSVLLQLHLSLLLSHFKAQSILSCFSFLVKAEWEEIFTESLEEALLSLNCSLPDNPITSRNDKAFFPKHNSLPTHSPLTIPSQQAPLSLYSFFIYHLLWVYCLARSNRCT